MYKNIIWDFDGTLFDTYPAIAAAFVATMYEYHVNVSTDFIIPLALKSVSHCVSTLAKMHNLPQETLRQSFLHHYTKIGYKNQPPFPFVIEICRHVCLLYGANVIVTHRGSEEIGLLHDHKMNDFFKGWITRDDNFPQKPDPTSFIEALSRFNLNSVETIAIGDRDIDILAAQRAGLFSCLFGTICDGVKPDFVFDNYESLHQLLEK